MSDLDREFEGRLQTLQDVVDDSNSFEWGLATVGVNSLQEVIDKIKKLQAEVKGLQGDAWISVEERLPDPTFDFVLVCADGAMSTIGYSEEKGFYEVYPIKTQIVIGAITHWMPLPEPPKGL